MLVIIEKTFFNFSIVHFLKINKNNIFKVIMMLFNY